MNYIDTHFHLDLWESPKDIQAQIELNKIYTIAVTNAPSVFKMTYELSSGLKYIRPALGYHPEILNQRPNEIELFLRYIGHTRYIGEVGLDYSSIIDKGLQRSVFEKIITASAEFENKIITIHSRRAVSDVVDIIGNNYPGCIILHWFSGSVAQLKIAISNGYYFSVNYPMTISKNGVEIIKNIPIERLLTESDGPFTRIDNKPSSPMMIDRILKQLSGIYCQPIDYLRKVVYNNFSKCLNLSSIIRQ